VSPCPEQSILNCIFGEPCVLQYEVSQAVQAPTMLLNEALEGALVRGAPFEAAHRHPVVTP
jgi:hypothetical protein